MRPRRNFRFDKGRCRKVTVARMAGDILETILKVYAHEFDKAKHRESNRAKLAEGTAIRLA
jgi:hypothetical protein